MYCEKSTNSFFIFIPFFNKFTCDFCLLLITVRIDNNKGRSTTCAVAKAFQNLPGTFSSKINRLAVLLYCGKI